jgi:hypothetical protein
MTAGGTETDTSGPGGLLTSERPRAQQISQKLNHWPYKTGLKSVEISEKVCSLEYKGTVFKIVAANC